MSNAFAANIPDVDVRRASPLLSVLIHHEEVGRITLSAQSYLLSEGNEELSRLFMLQMLRASFYKKCWYILEDSNKHAHSCTPKILADKN